MAIITLTSDLGLKDYYVAAVKGTIFNQLPKVTIVDISHQLEQYDIFQASYILKNAYPHFPQGTVHIIGVNAQPDVNAPYIAVSCDGHYFIGADNGVFSLLFDKSPDKIVELNLKQDVDTLTFPMKDLFVKAACHLARGGTLEVIGSIKEKFNEKTLFRPAIENDSIRGTIIYIDSYNNVVSNITKKLFKEVSKERKFIIDFVRYHIDTISESYNEVVEGELVAMFNSAGYLEIAMNKGRIASLLNINYGDIITLRFK